MPTGSCLCGGVRYQISGMPGRALYCHCTQCRKAHGTAFRARLAVPVAAFTLLAGAELITEYRSSHDTVRRFCRVCGSPLMNSWAPAPDVLGVAMGTLDDDPGVRPDCHVFVASKAPWHEITDALPRHAAFPS